MNSEEIEKTRILKGFILAPLAPCIFLAVLFHPSTLNKSILISYSSTIFLALPLFLFLFKSKKINFSNIVIMAVLSSLIAPLMFFIIGVFAKTPLIPIVYLALFFAFLGVIGGLSFWYIVFKYNGLENLVTSIDNQINLRGVIISAVILYLLSALTILLGILTFNYLQAMTWASIAIVCYSGIVKHYNIHSANSFMKQKINQALYGLVVLMPLQVISILINIDDSLGSLFAMAAGIVIIDGYYIFTKT